MTATPASDVREYDPLPQVDLFATREELELHIVVSAAVPPNREERTTEDEAAD